MRELTPFSIFVGIILAIVFGAANAYLGLKVGMTVSASIPAAVVSMGIMRLLFRRQSVRENNIVQTITSAGESLAAGVIFTVPALILLGMEPSILYITTLALVGGILGVLAFIPFRKRFIEDEEEELVYPEGRACAQVLQAPDRKGDLPFILAGLVIGAVVRLFVNVITLLRGVVGYMVSGFSYLALDLSPALLGVGYILGQRISSYILAGGLLSWIALIPLISYLTGMPLSSESDAFDIWNKYIRYSGAGAVLVGGIISFLKNIKAFEAFITLKTGKDDLPFWFVALGLIALIVFMAVSPMFHFGIIGTVLTVLFAIIFVGVSGRIVGIVGSSSNPISGMTIATLVIVAFIIKKMGLSGQEGMIAALTTGAVVCIAAAIAGDTSQDLKTGYLVGAKPSNQQIAELIGVLVSALVIGWVLLLLHQAYTIGSKDLPAPQATLMALILKGSFGGGLPWMLIAAGGSIAIIFELLGINALAVAVGLYLPLELSTTIFAGALFRRFLPHPSGTVYASGIIAGDALMGIIAALLIVGGFRLSIHPLPDVIALTIVIVAFALPLYFGRRR